MQGQQGRQARTATKQRLGLGYRPCRPSTFL